MLGDDRRIVPNHRPTSMVLTKSQLKPRACNARVSSVACATVSARIAVSREMLCRTDVHGSPGSTLPVPLMFVDLPYFVYPILA